MVGAVVLVLRHRDDPPTRPEGPDGSTAIVAPDGRAAVTPPADPAAPADLPGQNAFDALRRDAIPAELLAAAGGGDPAKAPPELVAVFSEPGTYGRYQPPSLAVSADGRRLASALCGEAVYLWDAATGKYQVLKPIGPTNVRIIYLTLSPDGNRVAASTVTGALHVWDSTSGKVLHVFQDEADKYRALAASPDGRLLAAVIWQRGIRLWDLTTGQEARTLDNLQEGDLIHDLAFSRDGKTLAGGLESGRSASGGRIGLWDVASGTAREPLQGWRGPHAIAWSPDGKSLASCSLENDLRVWNLATAKSRLLLPGRDRVDNPFAVAFSPDGKTVACRWKLGLVRLWDAANGNLQKEIELPGDNRPQRCLAFTPEGRHLVTVWFTSVYVLRLGPVAGR